MAEILYLIGGDATQLDKCNAEWFGVADVDHSAHSSLMERAPKALRKHDSRDNEVTVHMMGVAVFIPLYIRLLTYTKSDQ